MKHKKLLSTLLALAMVFSLSMPALADESESALPQVEAGDTVILHTNDVHTYIDNDGLRYSDVAGLKAHYEALGAAVILVDAGDHIQGTAYGSMDQGETIIDLMNAAGYDLATLGNHEFDYGMAGTMSAIEQAGFDYVSANFYHEEDGVMGETVLAPYQVIETGGAKIGFVGITTPESFTKSTPAYFQNEDGEYIYGIAGGLDGAALYAAVQTAVDAALKEADFVIALGHLGVDEASRPWTSEEVIANTTGISLFIDGHSHTTVVGREAANANGDPVDLCQTGEYLGGVGVVVIDREKRDGSCYLLSAEDIAAMGVEPDAEVAAIENAWVEEINTQLGQVIGWSNVVLDNYDADGGRLVRSQETNTGDFAADALYYLFHDMDLDVDVAIMNGGGVRNKAVTGQLSYLTMKEIHAFGNVACLQTVTGQQILDALEWGARDVGSAECGGFLQVSGLKYTIDASVPSTVQADDKGVWTGGPTGAYRVRDVMVLDNTTLTWAPLDLNARYNLAGYNYTLRDLGDGYSMFDGAVNVLDYVMEDYMVLANYVRDFPVDPATGLPTVGYDDGDPSFTSHVDYSDVNGMGRITILNAVPAFTDLEGHWAAEAARYCYARGMLDDQLTDEFKVNDSFEYRGLPYILWDLEGQPAYEGGDIQLSAPAGEAYVTPIQWGLSEGIGHEDVEDYLAPITREEVMAFLHSYAEYKGVDVSARADLSGYADAGEVSDWADEHVQWAVASGLVGGRDAATLAPDEVATRGEIATMLMRLLKNILN